MLGLQDCLAGDENELAELLSRALTFVCCDSLFVKTSAPYRLPARGDGIANGALAQALSKVLIDALGAKQVIWGSDWPFTQHERLQDFENCVLQGKQWIAGKSKLLPGFPIHLLG